MRCILLINTITTHLKLTSHHIYNGTFSNPTRFSSSSFWKKRGDATALKSDLIHALRRGWSRWRYLREVWANWGASTPTPSPANSAIVSRSRYFPFIEFPQECRCSCFLFELGLFSPSRRVVLLAARMFSAQKTMISEQFFQQFSSRGDITNCQF